MKKTKKTISKTRREEICQNGCKKTKSIPLKPIRMVSLKKHTITPWHYLEDKGSGDN